MLSSAQKALLFCLFAAMKRTYLYIFIGVSLLIAFVFVVLAIIPKKNVAEADINDDLFVKASYCEQSGGFQDITIDKTIYLKNRNTGAELDISFSTQNTDELYFYIQGLGNTKAIAIVDLYQGKNTYDYNTLSLIGKDCLHDNCGGYATIDTFGKPIITYTKNTFIK